MGTYLNPGSQKFKFSLNGMVYVDKSSLISVTNSIINTPQRFACLSRPRRFGKTMAIEMLSAYYGCGEETGELFKSLKIQNNDSFPEHLNKYNCLMLNMQDFLSSTTTIVEMLSRIVKLIVKDIKKEYPYVILADETDILQIMSETYEQTGKSFVILIDEWDCVFREHKEDHVSQKTYLDFLRMWLKDQEYIALAYMTGILPIKKYGTHSALNMFSEYSMLEPWEFAPYFGFTENEVESLCASNDVDMEEMRAWFDGYRLEYFSRMGKKPQDIKISIYSPRSVVESIRTGKFNSYWNQTETYEALKAYIQMDFEGLKEDVVAMLAGASVPVETRTFVNDMSSFEGKDDVMTLLVHLGYLTFDSSNSSVAIPNKEVSMEFIQTIKNIPWGKSAGSIKRSAELIESVWRGDSQAVADGIEKAHQELVSILQYNDEDALSYVVGLAFYAARDYYQIHCELASGKGFADIVMIPRTRHANKPALVVELKWDKSAYGAIEQIKERKYMDAISDAKEALLVGINYEKASKRHECVIEKWIVD
ncbi:MAG: ATP-binding protein [Eubacteriaceae bacterium]|nr:ATP-binding protein [Eubacteriaceae bacterium]